MNLLQSFFIQLYFFEPFRLVLAFTLFKIAFIIYLYSKAKISIFCKEINLALFVCRLLLVLFGLFCIVTFISVSCSTFILNSKSSYIAFCFGIIILFFIYCFYIISVIGKVPLIEFVFFMRIKPFLDSIASIPLSSKYCVYAAVLVVVPDSNSFLVLAPEVLAQMLKSQQVVGEVYFAGEELNKALVSGNFGRLVVKDGLILLPDLDDKHFLRLRSLLSNSKEIFTGYYSESLKASYDHFRIKSSFILARGLMSTLDDSQNMSLSQKEALIAFWNLATEVPITVQHKSVTLFSHPLLIRDLSSTQLPDGSFDTKIKANVLTHWNPRTFDCFIKDNELLFKFLNDFENNKDVQHIVSLCQGVKYNPESLAKFYGTGNYADVELRRLISSKSRLSIQKNLPMFKVSFDDFFDNFQYHYRSLPVEIGLDPSHPKKVQRISLRATELSYYSKLSDIERDNLVMVLKPHDNIYSKLLKTSINCQQFAAFSKNALDNNFCDYRVNAEMLRTILKLCKK